MASWSNEQGIQYLHDMDSNGKKLKVTGATPNASTFQAEFEDTRDQGNAVKVNGKVQIERGGSVHGRIQSNVLAPESPLLFINANVFAGDMDPDVTIGWRDGNLGNTVWIMPKFICVRNGAGPTTDYPVSINGPVRIQGLNAENLAAKIAGGVQVEQLDLFNESVNHLDIGPTNAANINIGRGAGTTSGDGSTIRMKKNVIIQQVDEDHPGSLNVEGNIQARQGTFSSHMLIGGNTGLNGSLSVDGNISVGTSENPANLTVNGETRLNGPILALSAIQSDVNIGTQSQQQSLTVDGICKLKNTVVMEQNADVNGDLDVSGRITSGELTAGGDLVRTGSLSATTSAVTLLQATTVENTFVVKEKSNFYKDVSLNGSPMNMEKKGQVPVSMIAQNDRLEFFVDGKLRYYIDTTGGHNA